jgi:hypothetical protein
MACPVHNPRKSAYSIVQEGGYNKIVHPVHGTVAAFSIAPDGRPRNIEFTETRFQKSNQIRIPAMDALAKWQDEHTTHTLDWRGNKVYQRRNPLFLPKSLFDSYIIRSTDGSVKVDRIQTIGGAEKKVRALAKRYPCTGWSILSAKHGTTIKKYEPSMGGGTPRVSEDNSREFKRQAADEARSNVEYRLDVNTSGHWEEFGTYETRKEAEKEGKREAGKSGSWRVKEVKGNPYSAQSHAHLTDDEYSDMMRDFLKAIPEPPRPLAKRYGPNYRNRADIAELERADNKIKSTRARMTKEYKDMVAESNRRFYARSKRNPSNSSVRNPASDDAASLYETFHGSPSEHVTEYITDEFERTHFAELGDLIELKVETTTGKLAPLNAPDPADSDIESIVKLASSPDGKQLYFIGGDQEIDVEALGFGERDIRDHMVIGLVCEFTYRTQKKFDNFEDIDYYHETGEETKVKRVFDDFRRKPTLLYNPIDRTMKLAGGLYEVKDVGVVN